MNLLMEMKQKTMVKKEAEKKKKSALAETLPEEALSETVSGSQTEQKSKGCSDYFRTEVYGKSERCGQNGYGTEPGIFATVAVFALIFVLIAASFTSCTCIPAGSFVCHYFHQLFQYG